MPGEAHTPHRVLVTGASGFAGRYLVPYLQRQGFFVCAAARGPLGVLPPGVEVARLPDLSQPFDAKYLMRGVDCVVHLAGLAHATAKRPEADYVAVNTEASRRLAIAARDARVSRFIHISSVRAQSGPSAAVILSEDTRAQPSDAYGRSKLASETAVAEALDPAVTALTILRPVLIYGEGVGGNMQSLIKLARLPVPLPLARLTGLRSLLYIENFASAVAFMLASATPQAGVFLVADREPISIPQIVTALRRGMGRAPGLFAVPQNMIAATLSASGRTALRDRLTGNLIVDTSRLKATGWLPVVGTIPALASITVA